MVAEAVERFLKSPERAEWIIDEVPWPHNTGCNGKILVPS
jgi:hypothetical protein